MDDHDQHDDDLPEIPREKDYSQLPQRPIRLKEGLPQEPISEGPPVAPPAELIAGDKGAKKAKAPRKAPSRWTLSGVAPEVREAAQAAAREQGMSLGAWVEGALRDRLESASAGAASTPDGEVAATLARIEERLGALEQRRTPLERLLRLLGVG